MRARAHTRACVRAGMRACARLRVCPRGHACVRRVRWASSADHDKELLAYHRVKSPVPVTDEISRLYKQMKVMSKVEESVIEYREMAQHMVEEIRSHVERPQAEGFLEKTLHNRMLRGCVFVGHIKTDVDSIAGAIGAAHLWKGIAAKSETELNGEIRFALKFAGLEAPPLFDEVPGAALPDDQGNLLNVCLVDHNERKQMTQALCLDDDNFQRIVGLIDHHALADSFHTSKPIVIDIRPWGSMASIIAHSFLRANKMIPKPIARMLLSAILSDTLNLHSVTTTRADRMLVAILGLLAEVDDIDALAEAQFHAKTEYIVQQGPYEMTRGDQKDFQTGDWKFGIAVLEVTNTKAVLERASELLLELRILKTSKGTGSDGVHDARRELDFAFLFVVDVRAQRSVLLICGGRELKLAQLAFPDCPLSKASSSGEAPGHKIKPEETMMDVGARVSRKSQFLPALSKALMSGFACDKKPMSLLTDEEIKAFRGQENDKLVGAIKKMDEETKSDSVKFHRAYTAVRTVFNQLGTTRF